ncbi:MAG: CUB domain-containing protein [Bacteroidota bacterium]
MSAKRPQSFGCEPRPIYDDGGPNGNYSNGINSTLNISNDENRNIRLDFNELSVEPSADHLYIFDNSGQDPVFLEEYSGTFSPFTEIFETSDISLIFLSNSSITYPGFKIDLGCAELNSTRNNILDIDWQVSPNPFEQSLTLNGLPDGEWALELQTTDGRTVKSWPRMRTSAGGKLTLSAEDLPAATYILQATDEDGGVAVKRVIKK